MNNFYIVITKWLKKTPDSPGYISGFSLVTALQSGDLITALGDLNVSPNRIDETVILNWASATSELRDLSSIYGFATVSSPDNAISYSVTVYENGEEYLKLKNNNAELFNRIDIYRNDYANLMDLIAEIKKKDNILTEETFINIVNNNINYSEVEELFNSI